jgi:phosphoserine aminotransferase
LKFSEDASFVYYCDNETVDGIEMPLNFIHDSRIPIVCDMSSNFMSREFDISRFGVIFGGAQKNIGPAGLTIVIVKEDLLGLFEKCPIKGPLMLDYKTCADCDSMYNTPPVFSIYMSGLVFKELLQDGGVSKAEALNLKKSSALYQCLDSNPHKYYCPVKHPYRSRMNVVFRILKDGKVDFEAETRFCKKADERGMICLNGHRSVGGIRASLYNALSYESVLTLIDFLNEFVP